MFLFILALLFMGGCAAGAPKSAPVHELTVYSKAYTIDRTYRSMTGPNNNQYFTFYKKKKPMPDMLWLTDFDIDIIDPITRRTKSTEYLCHSHLRFNKKKIDLRKRYHSLAPDAYKDPKIFTLIQGRTEVHLPKGFGVPILSNEPFVFHSMVINHNPVKKPFELQVKSTFKYLKAEQLTSSVKPLFRRCVTLQVPVTPKEKAKLKCLCQNMGDDNEADEPESAVPMKSTKEAVRKTTAGEVSYHWMVPPGRHQYRARLPGGLQLPYDTTAHYISMHIHAYGTFCELRDLTTGKSLYKSQARNYKDRVGIQHSDAYSSADGIPVFKNHAYEMVCEYNNTTAEDIDAMGVMYLYFLNKKLNVTYPKHDASKK